jgi:hypothetical protein
MVQKKQFFGSLKIVQWQVFLLMTRLKEPHILSMSSKHAFSLESNEW